MHGAVLRLALRLLFLLLLFSTALAFGATGVFSDWWYGVIGAGIFVLFLGLAPLLINSASARLPEVDRKSGAALLQAFGALCVLELLVMGVVTWAYGNRTLSDNNAYQALGLIIFLAMLGVGIMGAIGTLARFAYVHNQDHRPINRRVAHT
jgi:hypothetical protein